MATSKKTFNRIQYLANGIIELVEDVVITLDDGTTVDQTQLHKIDENFDLTVLTTDSQMVAQFALQAKAQFEAAQPQP